MNSIPVAPLCTCGCGMPVGFAKRHHKRKGIVKGQPLKYASWHWNRGSVAERLTAALKVNPVTGCHEWQKGRSSRGYGTISIGERTRSVHVVVWEQAHGPVPAGMHVCHRCDNPPCAWLDHLFLGTHQDNVDDKVAKGRHLHGETHPNAKLTDAVVREIRHLYASGELRKSQLSRRYGITKQVISAIITRKSWKHVG